jgi:hypothetical protein
MPIARPQLRALRPPDLGIALVIVPAGKTSQAVATTMETRWRTGA